MRVLSSGQVTHEKEWYQESKRVWYSIPCQQPSMSWQWNGLSKSIANIIAHPASKRGQESVDIHMTSALLTEAQSPYARADEVHRQIKARSSG